MSANNPPPAPTEGFLVIGYLKKLVSWMKKNRPIAGPGILAKQTEGGIVFSAAPSIIQIGLELWELYQEDASGSPLQISMKSGVVVNTNTTSLYPTNTVVNYTPANVANGTTVFWVKVSVAKATYQTYWEVWGVTAIAVQTGASLPSDTLNIPADTDGNLYFQIGTVTAASGAVTNIVQDLSYPVTVVFPLGVVGEEFTCPVEEA